VSESAAIICTPISAYWQSIYRWRSREGKLHQT
jgi:hypothetical protein